MNTAKTRYVMVGAACALLYNALMIAAAMVDLHYAPSLVIAYPVVVAAGYLLHAVYTFQAPLSISSFVKYAIPMAANFPLTLAGLFLLCDVGGLPVAIASPTLTVVMFFLNYLLSRWAILGGRGGQ